MFHEVAHGLHQADHRRQGNRARRAAASRRARSKRAKADILDSTWSPPAPAEGGPAPRWRITRHLPGEHPCAPSGSGAAKRTPRQQRPQLSYFRGARGLRADSATDATGWTCRRCGRRWIRSVAYPPAPGRRRLRGRESVHGGRACSLRRSSRPQAASHQGHPRWTSSSSRGPACWGWPANR